MDTKTLVDNGLKNFGYQVSLLRRIDTALCISSTLLLSQLFFGSDSGSELLYNNVSSVTYRVGPEMLRVSVSWMSSWSHRLQNAGLFRQVPTVTTRI